MSLLQIYAQKAGIIILAIIILAGCTPGPDYRRPTNHADIAPQFQNAPAEHAAHISQDNQVINITQQWWDDLKDPQIHQHIALLMQQNLDLAQGAARIEQAKAQINVIAGGLYPSLSAGASRGRTFRAAEEFGTIFGGASPTGGSTTTRVFDTQIETSFSTSWQVDLFGQIRTRIASAQADYTASKWDQDALLHSLIAQLITQHIALNSAMAQQQITQDMVEKRQILHDSLQRRYDLGTESNAAAANLLLARQTLDGLKADLAQGEENISLLAHSIDILLGQSPGTYIPAFNAAYYTAPQNDIPPGIPAYLLDHRPDIRGAEFRLIAANADIGVAMADLYPNLSITGSIGFEDNSTKDLFNAERLLGSLLGQVTAPIFEGGARRAQISLAKAQRKELAAAYAQNILHAIEEVENALVQSTKTKQRASHVENQLHSAQLRQDIQYRRYQQGVVTFDEYLDAVLATNQAHLASITAKQDQWNARINLYLALGGDWIKPIDNQTAKAPIIKQDKKG